MYPTMCFGAEKSTTKIGLLVGKKHKSREIDIFSRDTQEMH